MFAFIFTIIKQVFIKYEALQYFHRKPYVLLFTFAMSGLWLTYS